MKSADIGATGDMTIMIFFPSFPILNYKYLYSFKVISSPSLRRVIDIPIIPPLLLNEQLELS